MLKKLILVLVLLPTLAYAQSNLSLGGTGWSTSTKGDLLVGTTSKIRYTRLPIGSTGNVLWVSGGQPAWVATSSLGIVSSIASSTIWAMFSATYPILFDSSTGVISTGFSTSTINVFSALNTFTGGLIFGNATGTILSLTSATTTNLFGTSISATNLVSTNATTTALSFTNATGTTAVFTTASTTNLFATNAVFRQATTTAFSFTNATGTVLSLTSGTTTNWSATNLNGTNLSYTNATSTTFGATNLSFAAITGSWLATNLQGLVTATTAPQAALSTGSNGFVTRWLSASSLSTGILRDNGTVAGVNATTSTSTLLVQGNTGTSDVLNLASSTGASMFIFKNTGFFGIATSSPTNNLTVATGSILVTEFVPNATSTAMTFDWRNGNTALLRYGTANVVVSFTNIIAGQSFKLVTCAPPSGTPGTIFFATTSPGITWTAGSLPASTATVKKCDVWSFIGTNGTSSSATSPAIFGTQVANF